MTKEKLIIEAINTVDYVTKQLMLINAQLKVISENENFNNLDVESVIINIKSVLTSQAELLEKRTLEKIY